MSTEGIKKDIVITDKESAEKFVEALEKAESIEHCKHGRIINEFHSCFDCENE